MVERSLPVLLFSPHPTPPLPSPPNLKLPKAKMAELGLSEERVHRVVYVETVKEEDEVRRVFSQCGDMYVLFDSITMDRVDLYICAYSHGVYLWKTGENRSSNHFFVEFKEQNSVKRARALQLKDYKVHVLAFSRQLTAHFEAVLVFYDSAKAQRMSSVQTMAPIPESPESRDSHTPRPHSAPIYPRSADTHIKQQYLFRENEKRKAPTKAPVVCLGREPGQRSGDACP